MRYLSKNGHILEVGMPVDVTGITHSVMFTFPRPECRIDGVLVSEAAAEDFYQQLQENHGLYTGRLIYSVVHDVILPNGHVVHEPFRCTIR